ncbi:MAG: TetR/AcrR family transcriptional regulator [Acidobacteriota bacterium]
MPASSMVARSEATIAKILAAAHSLFVAKNYAEVTTAQIARVAELTKGAIYHHFASKEELYLALLHTDLGRKRELFRRAVDSAGSCRERLGLLTEAFLDLPRDSRQIILLVRRDINVFRDPARAELVRAYQEALPEQVEAILRDGIRDGELAPTDPRLLSWYYVALVEVTLSAYADTLFADNQEKLNHVLDLFFGGSGAVRNGAKA